MQRMNTKAIQKMETKKSRLNSSSKKAQSQKVVSFIGEVKQELKKVEWTNKEELKTCTKIVLASTFIFAIFVYFIDLFVQGFLDGIHLFVKFFIG